MADQLEEALRPPGPVTFEVREHRLSGIITLAVRGELDPLTAPKLAARVGELLRAEPGDPVLDLARNGARAARGDARRAPRLAT